MGPVPGARGADTWRCSSGTAGSPARQDGTETDCETVDLICITLPRPVISDGILFVSFFNET